MSVQAFDSPRGFVSKSEYFRVLRENDELRDRLRYHEQDKCRPVLLAHEVEGVPTTFHGRAKRAPQPGSLCFAVLASLREAPAFNTSAAIGERIAKHKPDVARALSDLVVRGYVERIDGRLGKGNRAIYRIINVKE